MFVLPVSGNECIVTLFEYSHYSKTGKKRQALSVLYMYMMYNYAQNKYHTHDHVDWKSLCGESDWNANVTLFHIKLN